MGRGDSKQLYISNSVARSRRHPPQISKEALLPKEMSDYFASIETKHFDASTATGSYFNDPGINNLNDLLARAAEMPGGLNRDDRALFNQEALRDDCRYLRVPAQGQNNIINSRDLDATTEVKAVRTKPGTPCSLVVEGQGGAEENFATLIIGPRPEGGGECVWTAHPGPPVKPAQKDIWPEGTVLSVAEVRDKIGDSWLQIGSH